MGVLCSVVGVFIGVWVWFVGCFCVFFCIGVFFVFGYSLVGLCVCCVVVFCVVLYGFGLFGLFGVVWCVVL